MSETFFRAKWGAFWQFVAVLAPFTPNHIDDVAAEDALKPENVDKVVALLKTLNIIRKP